MPVVNTMSSLDRELHDLCQPLTTLQCRLELAQMLDDVESLRDGVAAGLEECRKLVAGVTSMRQALLEARSGEAKDRR